MQKIKEFLIETEKGKGILTILILLISSGISFLSGRLSSHDSSQRLKIEYPEMLDTAYKTPLEDKNKENDVGVIQDNNGRKDNYFASIKGKKYYPAGCSAGKNLKLENRVYFSTAKEAQEAGYELSSSCK